MFHALCNVSFFLLPSLIVVFSCIYFFAFFSPSLCFVALTYHVDFHFAVIRRFSCPVSHTHTHPQQRQQLWLFNVHCYTNSFGYEIFGTNELCTQGLSNKVRKMECTKYFNKFQTDSTTTFRSGFEGCCFFSPFPLLWYLLLPSCFATVRLIRANEFVSLSRLMFVFPLSSAYFFPLCFSLFNSRATELYEIPWLLFCPYMPSSSLSSDRWLFQPCLVYIRCHAYSITATIHISQRKMASHFTIRFCLPGASFTPHSHCLGILNYRIDVMKQAFHALVYRLHVHLHEKWTQICAISMQAIRKCHCRHASFEQQFIYQPSTFRVDPTAFDSWEIIHSIPFKLAVLLQEFSTQFRP